MNFYFLHDGLNHQGPFTIEQLKAKSLNRDTPVWTEGLGDWSAIREIPELVRELNLLPSPPPFKGIRKGVYAAAPVNNLPAYIRETVASPEYHPPVRNMELTGPSDYDQELYQMEMENFFTDNRSSSRYQFLIAVAVVLAGSLTFWLIRLL
ncbi:MAG: DUF4339 domain-containing protein [Chitinophagaceae bacterium]